MKAITLNEYCSLSQQELDNFTGIIKHINGDIEYRKNRKYHREDGPAVICPNGLEVWYFKGKQHRIGGPAYMYKLYNIEEYWIHGQKCSIEAHDLWVDLMKLKELKSKL